SVFVRAAVDLPEGTDPQQTFMGADSALYILAEYRNIYKVWNNDIRWKWTLPDSMIGITMILPMKDGRILFATPKGVFTFHEDDFRLNRMAAVPGGYYIIGFYDDYGDAWLASDGGTIC